MPHAGGCRLFSEGDSLPYETILLFYYYIRGRLGYATLKKVPNRASKVCHLNPYLLNMYLQ